MVSWGTEVSVVTAAARVTAVAWVQSLARELRHTTSMEKKKKKTTKIQTPERKKSPWGEPGFLKADIFHRTSVDSFFFFFFFLGPNPRLMEVPRLGAESELQLPAYTTTITTQNPSHICDSHHSSWQRWILNPLSKAKDRTHLLMDTSQVRYHWTTTGTPTFVNSCHRLGSWKDRQGNCYKG